MQRHRRASTSGGRPPPTSFDLGYPCCDEMPNGTPYLTGTKDLNGRAFITVPSSVTVEEAGSSMLTGRLDYLVHVSKEMFPIDTLQMAAYVEVVGIEMESLEIIALGLHALQLKLRDDITIDVYFYFSESSVADVDKLCTLLYDVLPAPFDQHQCVVGAENMDRYIEPSQRTCHLGGTLGLDFDGWIQWRMKVEHHMVDCNSCMHKAETQLRELSSKGRGMFSRNAIVSEVLELKLVELYSSGQHLIQYLEKWRCSPSSHTVTTTDHYQCVINIIKEWNEGLQKLHSDYDLLCEDEDASTDETSSDDAHNLQRESHWFRTGGAEFITERCSRPGSTMEQARENKKELQLFRDKQAAAHIANAEGLINRIQTSKGHCKEDIGRRLVVQAEDLKQLIVTFGKKLDDWYESILSAIKWHEAAAQLVEWVVACSGISRASVESQQQSGTALQNVNCWIEENPYPAQILKQLETLTEELRNYVHFVTEMQKHRVRVHDAMHSLRSCQVHLSAARDGLFTLDAGSDEDTHPARVCGVAGSSPCDKSSGTLIGPRTCEQRIAMGKAKDIFTEMRRAEMPYITQMYGWEQTYYRYLTSALNKSSASLLDHCGSINEDVHKVFTLVRTELQPSLETCKEDPFSMGRVFKEKRLDAYKMYYYGMASWPEALGKTRDELRALKEKLDFPNDMENYLALPHKQLALYKSCLERLAEACPRVSRSSQQYQDLKFSVKKIQDLCYLGNIMLGLQRLDSSYTINHVALGRPIRMGEFSVGTEQGMVCKLKKALFGKRVEHQYTAFLFERAILLAAPAQTECSKAGCSDKLTFVRQLKLQSVQLTVEENNVETFVLEESAERLVFKSDDNGLIRTWIDEITKLKGKINTNIGATYRRRSRKLTQGQHFFSDFTTTRCGSLTLPTICDRGERKVAHRQAFAERDRKVATLDKKTAKMADNAYEFQELMQALNPHHSGCS
ncbi:uncharacterized protein LOC135814304 isoform X2 [Sycon ciliatum]|uniref:uncharacterized protein LOC135814304 isoform X2 n=1 Tax=Sycon ciliatum TaxID=27933 RepID=UPI0031F6F050